MPGSMVLVMFRTLSVVFTSPCAPGEPRGSALYPLRGLELKMPNPGLLAAHVSRPPV